MSQQLSTTRVGHPSGSPATVLAAARAARLAEQAAASAQLALAVEWAGMHAPTEARPAADWWEAGVSLPLAGEGAPEVAEYAVAEFAAALGITTDAGRRLIGHGLELAHRLPRLWAQTQAGRVPAWRARQVAEATIALTPAAAGFVDRQVAAVAGKVSHTQLQHLLVEAKVRHEHGEWPDPSDPHQDLPDRRRVVIDTGQVSFDGTVEVYGALDLVDATHLDQALSLGAQQLALAGSVDSLDARRAAALGEMSRSQLALTYDPPTALVEEAAQVQVVEEAAQRPSRNHPRPARPVTLYVHLSESALTGQSPVGRCESTRTPISTETIRAWCGHPDAQVTIRPVLDLAGHVRVDQYEIPDRLVELIDHRDGHCVFPWCTRPARSRSGGRGCDHDHVTPYDPADPARGPTCICNLAPLCRSHHRLKTHTGWRYRTLEPGTYLWTSPHGYRYLADQTGTTDVTPTGHSPGSGCLVTSPDPAPG